MAANDVLAAHDDEFDRLLLQEELILDVTEKLTQALNGAGVTKAELARRLGRSPGFVSQVFGGGRNLTLRTISDIAAALSLRPALELSSCRESAPELETRWMDAFQSQWTPPPNDAISMRLPSAPRIRQSDEICAAA